MVGSEEALNEESNDGHKEVTGKLLKLYRFVLNKLSKNKIS